MLLLRQRVECVAASDLVDSSLLICKGALVGAEVEAGVCVTFGAGIGTAIAGFDSSERPDMQEAGMPKLNSSDRAGV